MACPRKIKVSSKLGLNIIGKHMILLSDFIYSQSMNQNLAMSRSGCTWITRLLINHIRKPIQYHGSGAKLSAQFDLVQLLDGWILG